MSDWLNWETRLAELARQGGENKWPNPHMQKLEESIIHRVSVSSMEWITGVWAVLRLLTEENRKQPIALRDYDRILQVTDPSPIHLDTIINEVATAGDIGTETANHQMILPQKGPWIDAPPGDPKIVSQPKLKAQAQWQARMSAGSKMKEWADGMREDVRWHVVQAIRQEWDAKHLAKVLEERWGHHGQHFGTIAVTELSMAYNDAYLLAMPDQHVVVPRIDDDRVCSACHTLLEGKVFWVAPRPIETPTKQQAQQWVWAGKSNIGRKREDWWPCIPLHPRCRHVFVRYRGGNPYSYVVRTPR